jgi:hypothetical protein
VHHIKIALLGPIVPQSKPVLLAEEMAMLDTMAEGRLIVGIRRGTTNEMLTYDLNPEESRERTDEGMELILRAWTEPQPFGWQGRRFHYRTVSVWPKPLQQPLPPMARIPITPTPLARGTSGRIPIPGLELPKNRTDRLPPNPDISSATDRRTLRRLTAVGCPLKLP